MPKVINDAFKNSTFYESAAKQNYTKYLKFTLKHDIHVRENDLIIKPNLFWLAANPDYFFSDHSDSRKVDLIEIKYPRSKCNNMPYKILQVKNFYVHYDNGKRQLQKKFLQIF